MGLLFTSYKTIAEKRLSGQMVWAAQQTVNTQFYMNRALNVQKIFKAGKK